MSNPLYRLEITKYYADLPTLRKKDVYIIKPFVNNSFKNTDLKVFNFVQKFIQAATLADITTIDGNCISQRSFETVEINSLRKELQ